MYIEGCQVGGADPFKTFDIRHSARAFGVNTAGFQLCSGPVYPQNTFISLLELQYMICVVLCWKYGIAF